VSATIKGIAGWSKWPPSANWYPYQRWWDVDDELKTPELGSVAAMLSAIANAVSPQPELFTRRQAADFCGVSLSAWAELESMGRIGPVPIRLSNRIVRYSRTQLMEWIRAGCPKRSGRSMGKIKAGMKRRSKTLYARRNYDKAWLELQTVSTLLKGSHERQCAGTTVPGVGTNQAAD
jgi:hypothetical protein